VTFGILLPRTGRGGATQSLVRRPESESSSTWLSFSKHTPLSLRGGMYLVVERGVRMAGAAIVFENSILGGP
jgi:hypothetical protein